MKLSTLVPLTGGLAAGYLVGTAAGRSRYDQLKDGASSLMHHPKLQQTVYDAADQIEAYSNRLPDAAGDLVDAAATSLQDRMTKPADEA